MLETTVLKHIGLFCISLAKITSLYVFYFENFTFLKFFLEEMGRGLQCRESNRHQQDESSGNQLIELLRFPRTSHQIKANDILTL